MSVLELNLMATDLVVSSFAYSSPSLPTIIRQKYGARLRMLAVKAKPSHGNQGLPIRIP
jgi:hypothetical protein